MSEIVHRHSMVQYDGSNAADVLEFFSSFNGPAAFWAIDSQDNGLVLRCEFPEVPGPPPAYLVEITEGDVFTRTTDVTGNHSIQGPWRADELTIAFVSVPTAAEFEALAARVAALEPPTTEQESL